jgi:hypothetical protein
MGVSWRPRLLIALAAVCAALLLLKFSKQRTDRLRAADKTVVDIHKTNAETLEREIRSDLPLGNSLSKVNEYLKERGIEFSFDASTKTVYATARRLNGSTMFSSKCLTLRFHCDDALKLKSIDARVSYTGP